MAEVCAVKPHRSKACGSAPRRNNSLVAAAAAMVAENGNK